MRVNVFSFTLAVVLGTFSILSLGFVLASIVPTARFAQPIGAAVLYPMLALSGLFFLGSATSSLARSDCIPVADHPRRGAAQWRVEWIGVERALGERGSVVRAVRCVHCGLNQGISLGVIKVARSAADLFCVRIHRPHA
jgi:hypothetical protein